MDWKIVSVTPSQIRIEVKASQEKYVDVQDKVKMSLQPFFTREATHVCGQEICLNLDSIIMFQKDQSSETKSEADSFNLDTSKALAFSLPVSFEPERPQEKTETSLKAGVTAAVSVGAANVVSTILLSQVIQFLWGAINSLQLIVLTVLYTELEMPDRCKHYLHKIMKYTNLDIIEVDDYLAAIFGDFVPTEPFSAEFEDLGYETSNFFLEMGPLMFLVMLFMAWVPIRKFLQLASLKCKENCLSRRMKQDPHFKMTILRFFLEGSIEINLSACICIKKMSSSNFEDFWFGVSTVLAFVAIGVQIILPLYLMCAKNLYFKDFAAGNVESRYKDLFEDLSPHNKTGLFYSSIFFFRRLFVVCLIMLFAQSSLQQMFGHILLSLLQLSFVLSTKPFDSQLRNWQESFNEIAVFISSYSLIFFTDYCTDELLQEWIGNSLLIFVVLITAFNFVFIIVIFIKRTITKCKRKIAEKRLKKQRAEVAKSRALRY